MLKWVIIFLVRPILSPTDFDLIRTSSLFQGLDHDALQRIVEHASLQQLAAEQFLFHQGDDLEQVWVVREGRLQLLQFSADGHQVILHIAGPGAEVGLVPALTHAPAPVSARAVENAELWAWNADEFRALVQAHPGLGLNSIAILGEHIRLYQDRIRELTTERVERRLARTLLRLAQQLGKRTAQGVLIDLPLSRQDLAEMSGTTIYSASRILRAWEDAGIVSSGREQVVITSPHKLVSIAEDLKK